VDAAQARHFAQSWIDAWNGRDLDAILRHYAKDVVFRSPRIEAVTGDPSGIVVGIDQLTSYWTKALAQAPDLRFELDRVHVGNGAITIAYRNHRGQNVAETLAFDDQGLVKEGIVTHA